MNERDIEITLKLLEEKQKRYDSRLEDVDECCGKLKGIINAEMRIVNERIVTIEQGMDNNCKELEKEIAELKERSKHQFTTLNNAKKEHILISEKMDKLDEKLDKKISKITGYYMKFSLGILISMAVGLIALLK